MTNKTKEKKQFTISNKRYTILSAIALTFRACPWVVVMKIIFLAAGSFLPILTVYATASLIEAAISFAEGTGNAAALTLPLILMLVMAVYGKLENAISQIANIHQRLSLYKTLRLAITERRARLKYAYVEDNDTYDLIQRVSTQPAERVSGTLDEVIWLTSMSMHLFSLLIVLFINVGWLALIVVAAAIPAQYVAMKNGRKVYTGFKESEKITRRAKYLGTILTQRDAVDERTMFGFSSKMSSRFTSFYQQVYTVMEKTFRGVGGRKTISDILLLLVSLGITGVLAYSTINGDTTVAMFVALVGMVFSLVQYTSHRIPRRIHNLTESAVYFNDLTEFSKLETVDGAEKLPSSPAPVLKELVFKDVYFAYPGADGHDVLKGVNFTINNKKHYAIVGANGAGKSTIIKLLTGLYTEYRGEILINGQELRDIPTEKLKAYFSVAYQDFARYGVSLEDNITLGAGNLDNVQDELKRTVELLGIDKISKELPGGYDAIIHKDVPDGSDLSGGQWQKIILARTFINPAPVLILDEPTSALDPISESNMYHQFKDISRERTTMFISHRLGSTKLADEIIVLQDGVVAEQGSNEQLIAENGLYAKMYEAQRSWYE